MRALPVLAALAALTACASGFPRGARPALVPPRVCPDGAPVRWLQHPACGRVCGYSCLPDRWRADAQDAPPGAPGGPGAEIGAAPD